MKFFHFMFVFTMLALNLMVISVASAALGQIFALGWETWHIQMAAEIKSLL